MMGMEIKKVSFRCPPLLLERITQMARMQGKTRTQFIIESLQLLLSEAKGRGGRIIPPYDGVPPISEMGFDDLDKPRKRGPYKKKNRAAAEISPPQPCGDCGGV